MGTINSSVNVNYKITSEGADKTAKDVDMVNKSIDKSTKSFKASTNALLGFNLSTMFLGMQLKRLGETTLRGIFKVFDNFDNNTTKMQESLLGLQASFEFLKFSIANALEGTIVERFVIWITELFVGLADFFNANSGWATALVTTFALLFAVGTAGMLYGQIALFVNAWAGLFSPGGAFVEGVATAATVSKFGILMNTLQGMAGIYLAIKGFNEWKEGDFLSAIGLALGSVASFIPGAVGAAFGAFAVVLSLTDIALNQDTPWSADWVATRISLLIGAANLFKWNPVVGGIAISAWIILEGIKSGAFEKIKQSVLGVGGNIYKSVQDFFGFDTSNMGDLSYNLGKDAGNAFNKGVKTVNDGYGITLKPTLDTTEFLQSSEQYFTALDGSNTSLQTSFDKTREIVNQYYEAVNNSTSKLIEKKTVIDDQFIPALQSMDTQIGKDIITTNSLREAIEALKSKTIYITTVYRTRHETD